MSQLTTKDPLQHRSFCRPLNRHRAGATDEQHVAPNQWRDVPNATSVIFVARPELAFGIATLVGAVRIVDLDARTDAPLWVNHPPVEHPPTKALCWLGQGRR